MPKSIEIKSVNSLSGEELEEIMEIERESFEHPWSKPMFLSENQSFLLALTEGKIAGYLCYSTVVDECHILNVAVKPCFRKSGIALSMLEKLFDLAESSGINFFYLEVSNKNKPAINLYKKLGFKELGIRKRYYEDGSDAIVMVK